MLLSQYRHEAGRPQVVVWDGGAAHAISSEASLYDIALEAIAARSSLRDHVTAFGTGKAVDLELMMAEGRMLPPLMHPDPAHLYLTGKGLMFWDRPPPGRSCTPQQRSRKRAR